jgi:hypothetical protein
MTLSLTLADWGVAVSWLVLAGWVLYAVLKPVAHWLSRYMPSRLPDQDEVRDYTEMRFSNCEMRNVEPVTPNEQRAVLRVWDVLKMDEGIVVFTNPRLDEIERALHGPTYEGDA